MFRVTVGTHGGFEMLGTRFGIVSTDDEDIEIDVDGLSARFGGGYWASPFVVSTEAVRGLLC